MRQDKKKKDRSAAALVLCFCMMAIISVFAVQASITKVRNNIGNMQAADVVKQKAVDAEKDASETSDANDTVVDSLDSFGSETDSASEYIFPVDGDIIREHSMDVPVYWETLDQYMTHSGIDIAAGPGTQVRACASGTVTRIEENDEMGVTVEINHGNDLISVYSNLAAEDLIELGEIVSRGTIIGKTGQSSMFEFQDPDHLHFEIRKNDQPADPLEYIR